MSEGRIVVVKYEPNAKNDFNRLLKYLNHEIPFVFLRFSDGEIELLKNRYLKISNGRTSYKNREFHNNFEPHDTKEFDPKRDILFRKDLIESALYKSKYYIKGIPAAHNKLVNDRDMLIRFNSGVDENLTYADLLMNDNYNRFKNEFIPKIFENYNVSIISNENAKLVEHFDATMISIPNNYFPIYSEIKENVLMKVLALKNKTVVLSSASSLTNVIGFNISKLRPDLTFIDVGSAINYILGFGERARSYHNNDKGSGFASKFKSKGYKW